MRHAFFILLATIIFCDPGLAEDMPTATGNGFAANGYSGNVFTANGYDQNGYERNGFSRNGYDRNGYDRNGYYRNGHTEEHYPGSLEEGEAIILICSTLYDIAAQLLCLEELGREDPTPEPYESPERADRHNLLETSLEDEPFLN